MKENYYGYEHRYNNGDDKDVFLKQTVKYITSLKIFF